MSKNITLDVLPFIDYDTINDLVDLAEDFDRRAITGTAFSREDCERHAEILLSLAEWCNEVISMGYDPLTGKTII